MKAAILLLVAAFGGLLVYCSFDFPPWGDPLSPVSSHVCPYYIENCLSQTHVSNIVTAVLADYRGYDTMFEVVVIFTAGIAAIFLLRVYRLHEPETRVYRHIPTGITLRIEKGGKVPEGSRVFQRIDSVWVPHDPIVQTTCRLIVPFIQIFGLYVIGHGHHSPGGGFQGGVILGASMIIFAVAFNLRSALHRLGEKWTAMLAALGVLIYGVTGAIPMLFNMDYLDYGSLTHLLGIDPVAARYYGILIVEIGVGIAVMAVMVTLYYNLASAGKQDEGL